jgi:uncharacterized metal-binding protein YceD (DUF177 family)
MSEALDWSYRVSDVPEGGIRETRIATDSERVRLAEGLDIISCQRLACELSIRAIGKGHYRLAGKVVADLTQACVVTLEPIAQRAEGAFDVEFWPPSALPESTEVEMEALSAAEIEPIEHGRIDAGRIVFETLATSLDPFPRKSGAEFHAELPENAGLSETGPFAALKRLKDQS